MRQTSHRYDEIIDMEYPLKSADIVKHPRMSTADRAKIFAPFAALKGYEEAIKARLRIVVPRIELSEEVKNQLDIKVQEIERLLKDSKHPIVTVVYFMNCKDKTDEGQYLSFTGMVAKIDINLRYILVVDKRIQLDSVYNIVIIDI